jgi:hypothetical protein
MTDIGQHGYYTSGVSAQKQTIREQIGQEKGSPNAKTASLGSFRTTLPHSLGKPAYTSISKVGHEYRSQVVGRREYLPPTGAALPL